MRRDDLTDFWRMFRFSENFQIFGELPHLQEIFRVSENFPIFGEFSDFRRIFRFVEKKIQALEKFQIFKKNPQIFGKISDFRIFLDFQILFRFLEKAKTMTMTFREHPQRVTLETPDLRLDT